MKTLHLHAVEFVGGPLDGHKHLGPEPVHERPETLALPINPQVLSVLDGARHVPSCPITSVAWYSREVVAGRWAYVFLGSTAPSESLTARSTRGH